MTFAARMASHVFIPLTTVIVRLRGHHTEFEVAE